MWPLSVGVGAPSSSAAAAAASQQGEAWNGGGGDSGGGSLLTVEFEKKLEEVPAPKGGLQEAKAAVVFVGKVADARPCRRPRSAT